MHPEKIQEYMILYIKMYFRKTKHRFLKLELTFMVSYS